MTWDGAGTFDRIHNFSADASAGIQALPARFDAEHDNVKGGLENCVTLTGETTPSANLPMGGNRHTGVGAATSAQEYLRADQNTQQVGIYVTGVITAAGLSASAGVFPAALTEGVRVCVHSSAGNVTGASTTASAPTLTVNGLAAPLYNAKGKAPILERLINAGGYADFVFNASTSAWFKQSEGFRVRSSGQHVFAAFGLGQTAADASAPVVIERNGNIVNVKLNTSVSISVSASTEYIAMEGVPAFAINPGGAGLDNVTNMGFVRINNSSSGIAMGFADHDLTSYGNEFHFRMSSNPAEVSGPTVVLCPFNLSYVVDE